MTLPPDAGPVLLTLARGAIESALGVGPQPQVPRDAWLRERGAAVVTLTQEGELRGCIGSIEARRPLGEDVVANAIGSALRDPRFPDLAPDELSRTLIEVSVLTTPELLAVSVEAEAIARLRPGVDGVVLSLGHRGSTFLPQVWEDLPDPAEFLAHLKLKAGLPARGWPPGLTVSTYQVTKFSEATPEGPTA